MAPHEAPRQLIHHVKVLGDRSMRFRYLNSNTALLVTGPGPGAPAGADAALTVYVVDTVTGRVLHQQTHADARGPVSAALWDNVGVVQYWDRAAFRWEGLKGLKGLGSRDEQCRRAAARRWECGGLAQFVTAALARRWTLSVLELYDRSAPLPTALSLMSSIGEQGPGGLSASPARS